MTNYADAYILLFTCYIIVLYSRTSVLSQSITSITKNDEKCQHNIKHVEQYRVMSKSLVENLTRSIMHPSNSIRLLFQQKNKSYNSFLNVMENLLTGVLLGIAFSVEIT